LGSATGLSDPNGNLTSATYGADKPGGTIANIARAPQIRTRSGLRPAQAACS